MRFVGPLVQQQDYGVALPKGSPLRKTGNQVVLVLKEKGVVAELNEKWFRQKE